MQNILQTTGGKNCYFVSNRIITAKPALLIPARGPVCKNLRKFGAQFTVLNPIVRILMKYLRSLSCFVVKFSDGTYRCQMRIELVENVHSLITL